MTNARTRYRQSDKGKEAKRRYRQTEAGKEEKRRWKRSLVGKRMNGHTFTGVDGEGWTDDNGTHHYMTLTVGSKTLYTGEPLTGVQCLAFLATRPVIPNEYYVSFFFDYDVTMILRDLAQEDAEKARRLFTPTRPGEMVWWRGFGIAYRPKKHLKVKLWTDDNSYKTVTVHDVQGFYQSSFVVALNKFQIGTIEQRKAIAEMKANRDSFSSDQAQEIITYSESECVLLAQLVSDLRDATHNAKLNASPYEGPGDMARRAIERHYGRETHKLALMSVPNSVHDMASKAYYGGRFEIMAHGPIEGTVYEYDLKSAYPAAMRELPCLIHGKWQRGIHSELYLANVEWDMSGDYQAAMPFPVRRKNGSIYFPTRGEGWYWSYEIEPVRDSLAIGNGWSYIPKCNCQPFQWVEELYYERLSMEAEMEGSGIALKLMLNTLYGKLAQQRPTQGAFFNMIYASLITSKTRARVYAPYLNGSPLVMFATDAIFSLEPLDLVTGIGLGQWELANTFNDMTIFQPGVYFDGDQAAFKTRGVPKSVFRDNAELLKASSLSFDTTHAITLESHMSLRLALSRGTPVAISNLGNWMPITKAMSANPQMKRETRLRLIGGNHWSRPIQEYGKTSPYNVAVSTKGYEDFRLDDDYISDGYYEGEF